MGQEEQKNLNIEKLPDTLAKREAALLGEEAKCLREFVGEDLLVNVMAVHKVDHGFFETLSSE
eukprot:CAMPEP_0170540202 /NCGR_PEP_ID=MMETSP0211-20121228/248_1 /TAXON_ID=311385 /ORGANISM="Pseudokeronopsis sp., Strain OXSARD2" /LENGTH=62 /DNA_ID=CAMNT_0010842515 /DNA_START=1118 /DNA_END=1306 /DNA_ORIENTATION=-